MKSTLRLFAVAVLACVSIVSATFGALREFAIASYREVKGLIHDGFKLVAGKASDLNPVSLRLIQARNFVQRFMKRERPVLTGSWRMCPSI